MVSFCLTHAPLYVFTCHASFAASETDNSTLLAPSPPLCVVCSPAVTALACGVASRQFYPYRRPHNHVTVWLANSLPAEERRPACRHYNMTRALGYLRTCAACCGMGERGVMCAASASAPSTPTDDAEPPRLRIVYRLPARAHRLVRLDPQQPRVDCHDNRAQRHDHRAQRRADDHSVARQYARSQGDADRVVGSRPDQVLHHLAPGRLR